MPKKVQEIASPTIHSFAVQKDSVAGYKVKLKWKHSGDQVVGYRIYKAVLSKNLLQRDYFLSQKTLEKVTSAKTPKLNSNVLYDKTFFVENSKVKFIQAHETKHKMDETLPKKFDYSLLSFVRKGDLEEYTFTDKNVKYGCTISYVVTALTSDMKETKPGRGTIVNIEDLSHPPEIDELRVEETFSGVLVTVVPDCWCDKIEGYQIFRRRVGDIRYLKIFEGETRGVAALLDTSVVPGNEYEYRAYFYDFWGNVGWSSPAKKVEFKSSILNKGAILDPMVKISFQDPYIIIEGYKNSDKIVGYRIERQDLWRYEKDFELKSFNDVYWPNVNHFDSNFRIKLLDETARRGRVYRYRISSISYMGKVESIFISPPIDPGKNPFVVSPTFRSRKIRRPRINFFDAEVKHSKQDPAYVKMMWSIVGDWDHLHIVSGDRRIKVDNIHDHIFYGGLEKGRDHKLKLEVFNLAGELVGVSNVVKIRI